MAKLTRKDLNYWKGIATNYECGYCTYSNRNDKEKFVKLGYNSGIYGWNWTLYYSYELDLLICDGYRNF